MFHIVPKYQNENFKTKNEETEDEKKGRYIHIWVHIYLFAYQYIHRYNSIWNIINANKKYIKTLLFLDHGTVSDLKHLSIILFCRVSGVSHNNITFFRAQCSQWIAGLILQSEKKKCLAQPGNQKRMCKTGHMIRVIHFLPSFLSPLISLSMTLPMIFISASKQ